MTRIWCFHLPDDSVMIFHIIRDTLKRHPEIIEIQVLVLHSDNLQEQCKSKFTFYEMKKLTTEF